MGKRMSQEQPSDTQTPETGERRKGGLRRHEDRARLAAIDQSMARIEFDAWGTILDANENFLAATGYTMDEVRGKKHKIFMFPEDAAKPEYEQHWKDLAAGKAIAGEFRRMRKDGTDVWIRATYAPLLDMEGKTSGVVKYAQDITDRTHAVAEVNKALARLAEGDLVNPITYKMSENFDSLRVKFNEAQAKLAQAMVDIINSTSGIHDSTNNLAASSSDLAKRTESQAASLEETASSLKSLAGLVDNTSKNAATAQDMVQNTKERAIAGTDVMKQAREAMDAIASSSSEISKITSVIDQISFQTNLLALNAGVEAARAGDAGRGFAVVASEVRALAQRSSEAATQIADLIETSGRQVQNGVDLVSRTGDSLTEIDKFVSDALVQVTEIADGTKEQAVGLHEVSGAIGDLDAMTKHNAAAFEETSAETQNLAAEVGTLRNAASAFKVNEDPAEDKLRRAS